MVARGQVGKQLPVPPPTRPCEGLARSARRPGYCRPQLGLRAVRPHALPRHRGRPRSRRHAARARRDRQGCCGLGGWQRQAVRPRPAPRRRPACLRGCAQRRHGRGATTGRGRQPQFRQPGALRGDVAVHRDHRRHRHGVRGVGCPGCGRQRLFLQRDRRAGHRSDAGGRAARDCRTYSFEPAPPRQGK